MNSRNARPYCIWDSLLRLYAIQVSGISWTHSKSTHQIFGRNQGQWQQLSEFVDIHPWGCGCLTQLFWLRYIRADQCILFDFGSFRPDSSRRRHLAQGIQTVGLWRRDSSQWLGSVGRELLSTYNCWYDRSLWVEILGFEMKAWSNFRKQPPISTLSSQLFIQSSSDSMRLTIVLLQSKLKSANDQLSAHNYNKHMRCRKRGNRT